MMFQKRLQVALNDQRGHIAIVVTVSLLAAGLLLGIGYFSFVKQTKTEALKENELLVSEMKTSQQEITTLKEKLFTYENTEKRLIKELEEATLRHQQLSKENTESKNTLTTVTNNYNQLLEEKKARLEEIENLKSEKTALIEQVRTIESNSFVTDTLKEKAMLEIQITRLEEELKQAKLTHTARLSREKQLNQKQTEELSSTIQKLEANLSDASMQKSKILLLQKEISQRDESLRTLEQKLEDAQKVVDNVAQQVEVKAEIVQKLNQKIASIQEEYNIMSNRLAETRKQNQSLEADLTSRDAKIKEQELEIKNLKTQVYQSQSKLKLRLQELARAKNSIENIMSRAQSTIMEDEEAHPITAATFKGDTVPVLSNKPTATTEATVSANTPKPRNFSLVMHKEEPLIQGKVIDIDRSHDFIIIDLGTQDGLKENMDIKILQNNSEIARAHILEAREEMSAANLNQLVGDYAIQPGDTVEILKTA